MPDDLRDIQACFSPGTANRKDFEDALTLSYGIDCHMCDFTSDEEAFRTPLIAGKQTFQKKWLSPFDDASNVSLKQWVEAESPDTPSDLILQIDIEGAEYNNIIACDADIIQRFRIIVIEIHHLYRLVDPEILFNVFLPFFEKLDRSFTCVHVHPNNAAGEVYLKNVAANMPNLLELTLLRKDRFTADASSYIKPMLPHPLDIEQNVPRLPPVFLSDRWLEAPRALESRLIMLQQELFYEKYASAASLAKARNELRSVTSLLVNAVCEAGSFKSHVRQGVGKADSDIEVAKGCRFTLSSSFEGRPLSGEVPQEKVDFFFHTNIEDQPWIEIDLGQSYDLSSVRICNRRDAAQERAQCLFLIVKADSEGADQRTFAFRSESGFMARGDKQLVIELDRVAGRYIRVMSAAYTALHLSDISVFARSPDPV